MHESKETELERIDRLLRELHIVLPLVDLDTNEQNDALMLEFDEGQPEDDASVPAIQPAHAAEPED